MSGPAKAILAIVLIAGFGLVVGGVYMLVTDTVGGPGGIDPADPMPRPTIGGDGPRTDGPDGSGGPAVDNTQTPPFRVDPNAADVNVVPPPQDAGLMMRAVVRDEDGKPFEGATVSVIGGDSSRARTPAMRDLGNGIYEISGLSEGEYVVKVRAPVDRSNASFAKAQATVRLDAYGQVKVAAFTVPRPGICTVEGYVNTAVGIGAGIELVFDSPAFEAHATTKEDGSYRVEKLPPAAYTFRAFYRGPKGEHADLANTVIDIPSTMTFSPLLEAGSLELTVTTDGPSAAGRRVEFLRIDQQDNPLAAVATSMASGITDSNGLLIIRYVPAGTYTIVVAGLKVEPDQFGLNYGQTIRTLSVRTPRSPYGD